MTTEGDQRGKLSPGERDRVKRIIKEVNEMEQKGELVLTERERKVSQCPNARLHVDYAEIRRWNFCPSCGVALR